MMLDNTHLALIIETKLDEVPFGLSDEILFLTVKKDVLSILENPNTTIHYFGQAPDNTADNNDELLTDGIFFRIIGNEKDLGVDLESTKNEILKAFENLISNNQPFWSTIIVEEGFIKKEITIELLYKELL